MAKGQSGREFIALPADEVDIDSIPDDRSDEEKSFDEFVTGLGAEKMGELRVGKLKQAKDGTPLANTRSAHCFSCPIDQYTFSELLEFISSKYGAGLFRIVGVSSGRKGVQFNKIIEIAESTGPKPAQDSPLQSPHNLFESVAKIMAESQARTEALIARLTERAPVTAPDPMDQMTKMAGLFATIMGAVPKTAAQAGGDLLDQLEKLVKLKELLGGAGGGGDSDKESNFYDVVKAGLQSFGPALATLAVRGAQTPALPGPQNGPIPMPPPQAAPASYEKPGPRAPQQGNDPAMASFKKQVDTLVQNAKMGVDPAQLAGTILDLTPDEKLDDLGNMLDAPDMIEKMAALNPEVQTYRDFFEKLRAALLSLLDDTDPDTLPQNSAGVPGAESTPGS